MSKILVVYYSLTGNTKFIAEAILESINTDILELKPVKELNAESRMKYVWGGFQAIMKIKPKLREFDINPLDYEFIILGTPVWSWTFSPTVRSFLSNFDLSGKKVALWTCSGGDGVKAMKRFKNALKGTNIIGEIRFQQPLQNKPEAAKEHARVWAKELIEEL
ncbi:MAG: flavodoxin family protein [Candidatus Thorarchaeota archaeon]